MKLKPCPFCGDRAHFAETPEGGHYIECRKCLAATSLMFPEKCEVRGLLAEKWNQRAAPPESRATALPAFGEWHDAKYPKPRAIEGTVALMEWGERRAYRQTGWDAAVLRCGIAGVAASGAAGVTTAAQEKP